jgi:GH24 family phage-related lysozyme (muramidase)
MAGLTTIAAGAALASSAAGAGMSFAQAKKQKDAAKRANQAAEKAVSAARKKLEINPFDALAVNKLPFELEREAATSTAAQLVEAGRESERGAAATAGRVQAIQNNQQADIAGRMGTEMANLDKLSATEDARLNNLEYELDLAEAEGAQSAAAQAENMAGAAMTQGIQGAADAVGSAISMAPLYARSGESRAYNSLLKKADKNGFGVTDIQSQLLELGKTNPNYASLSGVEGMDAIKMQDYMTSNFDKKQLVDIYGKLKDVWSGGQ